MAKDNELGAAHVLIGAELAPLRAALPNAQRLVNTSMQRMANSAAQFGTNLGKSMGRVAGFVGFAGLGGTLALATREAVKQFDAMKGLAAATAILGIDFRKTSADVDGYTKKLQKMFAVSKATVTGVTAFLVREGKFQGRALDAAVQAAFGYSAISGTPMEAAQFIKGAKFGQPMGEERYGLKFGAGLFPGSRLEEIVARGREGIGIQQQIARAPVEQGRRVLVRSLDRLAAAVNSGIERLGVLDRLFTEDPQGVIGISPAKTLFQQGVDDVVHPVVLGAQRNLDANYRLTTIMGAMVAGGVAGFFTRLFTGVSSGPGGPKTELQQRQADVPARVAARILTDEEYDAKMTRGRELRLAKKRLIGRGFQPGTAAFDAALDLYDLGMGAARNAVQRLDEALTPGPDTFGLGDVSVARSDYETGTGGLDPATRASRGGPAPGENTLQNPVLDVLKDIRDNTAKGGLQ